MSCSSKQRFNQIGRLTSALRLGSREPAALENRRRHWRFRGGIPAIAHNRLSMSALGCSQQRTAVSLNPRRICALPICFPVWPAEPLSYQHFDIRRGLHVLGEGLGRHFDGTLDGTEIYFWMLLVPPMLLKSIGYYHGYN